MKNKGKLGLTVVIAAIVFCFPACGGGGKVVNSAEELKAYLDSQPANSPDKPIKVSMGANELMLPKIRKVLNSEGKYVSLNITGNALATIPEEAFEKCETLVGITIPNSINSIGENAFYRCTSLTSVTIPNSVINIGENAFCRCTSLTSITIPKSVTSFGDEVFFGCEKLASVTFQGTIYGDYNSGKLQGTTKINGISADIFISLFHGDLDKKYLAGGPGTYTTTAPVNNNSVWTKK